MTITKKSFGTGELSDPIAAAELPDWLVRDLLPITFRLIGRDEDAHAAAVLPRVRPDQVDGIATPEIEDAGMQAYVALATLGTRTDPRSEA